MKAVQNVNVARVCVRVCVFQFSLLLPSLSLSLTACLSLMLTFCNYNLH